MNKRVDGALLVIAQAPRIAQPNSVGFTADVAGAVGDGVAQFEEPVLEFTAL